MSVINVDEIQTFRPTNCNYGVASINDLITPFVCRFNEKLCPGSFVKAIVRDAHQRSVSRGESGYQMKGFFMTKAEAYIFNIMYYTHFRDRTISYPHFLPCDEMVSLTALYPILETERKATEAGMQPKENIVMQPQAKLSKYNKVGWIMFAGVNTPYVRRQGGKFCAERIVRHRILNAYEDEIGAKNLWYPFGMHEMTSTEAELFRKYDQGRCGTLSFETDSLVPIKELKAFGKELEMLDAKMLHHFLGLIT